MKFLKKSAKWILAIEVAVSAVLLVGLLVPLPGKLELKIVQSGSMEPELPVGSVVAVVPTQEYRVGDIITFGKDTKKRIPTTHRIVEIERKNGGIRYITKGDANEEADNGQVAYASVIGKVVADVPRLGYVLDFARSRNGFTFMVVVPALFIVLDELLTIVATVRSMRKQKVAVTPERREKRSNKKEWAPAREVPPALRHCRAGIDGYSVVLRAT